MERRDCQYSNKPEETEESIELPIRTKYTWFLIRQVNARQALYADKETLQPPYPVQMSVIISRHGSGSRLSRWGNVWTSRMVV